MADYNTLIRKHHARLASAGSAPSQPGFLNLAPESPTPPAPPQAALRPNHLSNQEHKYPLEVVNSSNQQLLNANFSHETISMSVFQNLCPSTVQLFSDGVYRIVKESNGIVTHVPALVGAY